MFQRQEDWNARQQQQQLQDQFRQQNAPQNAPQNGERDRREYWER
jgi:hypothetical protein